MSLSSVLKPFYVLHSMSQHIHSIHYPKSRVETVTPETTLLETLGRLHQVVVVDNAPERRLVRRGLTGLAADDMRVHDSSSCATQLQHTFTKEVG
jgi:hypothetical protein